MRQKFIYADIKMAVSGAMIFLGILILVVLFFVFTGRCHNRDGYHPNHQDLMTKRRNRTISKPTLSDDGCHVTLNWKGNPQLVYSFIVGHRHAPLASGHGVTASDHHGHFSVPMKQINLDSVKQDNKVEVEIWSNAHDDFHAMLSVNCTA